MFRLKDKGFSYGDISKYLTKTDTRLKVVGNGQDKMCIL